MDLNQSASAKHQVFNNMIRAKQDVEEKKLMMNRLQARINKLKTEEFKTVKSIQDAKRMSDFIAQMREEKAKKREEKEKLALE
jgi:hypothetical protein